MAARFPPAVCFYGYRDAGKERKIKTACLFSTRARVDKAHRVPLFMIFRERVLLNLYSIFTNYTLLFTTGCFFI